MHCKIEKNYSLLMKHIVTHNESTNYYYNTATFEIMVNFNLTDSNISVYKWYLLKLYLL